jgi:hypothetical protein
MAASPDDKSVPQLLSELARDTAALVLTAAPPANANKPAMTPVITISRPVACSATVVQAARNGTHDTSRRKF